MEFLFVDCFAEKRSLENQLAVFIVDRPVSDDEIQMIAREMNCSEPSFIFSGREEEGVFNARLFTPYMEVAFAAHLVLCTAHVVDECHAEKPTDEIRLNLSCGQIAVLKTGDTYTMIQN